MSALAELKHELEGEERHDDEHRDGGHHTGVPRVHQGLTRAHLAGDRHDPAWTARYGYGGTVDYDLRPGGKYIAYTSEAMRQTGAPDVAIDGEAMRPTRRTGSCRPGAW